METTIKSKIDRLNLLQLFPEEVWTIIFLKLDLFLNIFQNLCNSSLFFRHFLKPTCVLLPKTLVLLEKKLHTKRRIVHHCPRQQRIYPPHNPSPVKNVLAKIRSVCKVWSRTVDKLARPHSTNYRFCLVTRLSLAREPFKNPEEEFLAHFQKSHPAQTIRSPFVGNSVKIFIGRYFRNPGADIHENPPDSIFKQVLLNFGSYIRHCEIFMNPIGATGLWYAKYLVNVLSSTPNLETFVLVLPCGNQYLQRNDLTLVRWEDLPDLIYLRRFGAKGVRKNFLGKLLAKMPHLERLEVGHNPDCCAFRRASIDSNPILLPRCKIPNLKHLEIDLLSECPGRGDYLPELEFGRVENWNPWDLNETFHYALATLSASAELPIITLELAITCSASVVWLEWRRSRFSFPELRNLKLTTRNWPCIDLVQQVQNSLEQLSIKIHSEESHEEWKQKPENELLMKDEHIKFLGCYDNLLASNIWDLMPKLEVVTVCVRLAGKANFTEKSWKREREAMVQST